MEGPRRRPRIADVAREAGVSKTSVSFAFNAPERLNPLTAARIRAVADSLGYESADGSQARPRIGTLTLGLVAPERASIAFASPAFSHLCGAIVAAAEQSGYGVLLLSPGDGALVRSSGRQALDGYVVVGLSERQPDVARLRRSRAPLVIVDGEAYPEHGSVDSADEVGARAAARHLVTLGHRNVVVVAIEPPAGASDGDGAEPAVSPAARRLTGFRQGLATARIQLGDERIVVGPPTYEGGMAAFQRVWDDGLRPTAVLTMNDAMAIGVVSGAAELGLRVPADLSVVGFDDVDLARHSIPRLTTVHQPLQRKGEEAVRLLLRLIRQPDHERPEHRRLETRLIVRQSTGPPPASRRPSLSRRRATTASGDGTAGGR